MTAHRVDIGSVRDPLLAGNPLRLDVFARTNSGNLANFVAVNLNDMADISYAVFRMIADLPANTPTFLLAASSGDIVVHSPATGTFEIHCTEEHTGMWTGRDWHVCRLEDNAGRQFDVFDGFVVSTAALNFVP